MSFLSSIGKDAKAVFAFLGSSKGKTITTVVEDVAEGAASMVGLGAPVQKGIDLVNTWLTEIIKTEALAAAAGQQTGSGETKAAAVVATMTPELTAFLQSQGLASVAVSDKAKTISDALVTVLNAIGDTSATPPPAAPATPALKPSTPLPVVE